MGRSRYRIVWSSPGGVASRLAAHALPFILAVMVSLTAQVPGAAAGVPGLNCRWAAAVVAFSSQYSGAAWSARQALGPPNTHPSYGDIPTAWASQAPDNQREFLVLAYDDPAPINFVNVYETFHPGAVDRIAVKNPGTGLFETVWAGTAIAAPEVSRVFTATFPMTPFLVSEVRLEFDSPAVLDWNEIDAVEIGFCDWAGSQWAATVLDFSSQYTTLVWSAQQALGAPDIYPSYVDNPNAWASGTDDGQREYLILGYDPPASINFVNVYETWNPDALDMVSVKNPGTGLFETVWTGTAAPAPAAARIHTVSFPLTPFAVSEVRLDFNSPVVPGWNEIDAVAIGRCCTDALVDVPPAASVPAASSFAAPRPNPFRGSTEFAFSLRTEGHVTIEVFSALGQRVTRLVDRTMPAGRHVARWTGRDEGGREVGSGIYYVRVEGDGILQTRKVVKIE